MDKIERLLVFGDIHGKWERFLNVYQKVGFNPEHDLMVFLGDYLDRGENPVPVMEWGPRTLWKQLEDWKKLLRHGCG